MTAPLEYEFKVIGRAVVEREIAALERRFIQSANRLNQEFNRLARNSGASGGNSGFTRTRDPVFGPGRREQLAQIRANERAAIKAANAQQRAEVNAIREKERAQVRAAREERRQVVNTDKSRQAIHNQRLREEKAQRNEALRSDREKQRAIDRQTRSQQSLARQRMQEEKSAYAAARSRAEFVKSTVGGGVGRVASAVGSVGRAGLAVAGLSAAAITASSISQAIELDEGSRRLSVAGRRAGQTGINPNELSKSFIRTGIATGVAPEKVMEGLRAYVTATGDLESGRRIQDIAATTAQGADANVVDVFKMSAAARQGLKIESDEDLKKVHAKWFEQGREGKFELRDFSTEGSEILQAASNLGVRGVKGAGQIGALAQIGMLGNGSASETTTSLRNLFLDVQDKADKIQAGKYFGGKKVDIYKGGDFRNGARDINEWLFDMISASEGNVGELGDAIGRRGIKTATPLANAYMTAAAESRAQSKAKGLSSTETAKQADIAGRGAMQQMWSRFNDIPADYSEVQRSASDSMKSFAVQMEIINSRLKDAISSQLFPILQQMIPQFAALVPHVARLVGAFVKLSSWLLDNPLKGLGIALAAAVTYEFAKAQIAKIITSGLTSVFQGIQTGGIGGGIGAITPQIGTGQTFGQAFGNALGPGLAIGTSVASGILATGIGKFELGENSMNAGGAALNAVRSAGVGDIEAVKAAIQEQKKRAASAHKMDLADEFLDTFGASNKAVEAKTQDSYLEEMVKKLDDLQAEAAKKQMEAAEALKKAADSVNGIKPNTSDKPSPIKP